MPAASLQAANPDSVANRARQEARGSAVPGGASRQVARVRAESRARRADDLLRKGMGRLVPPFPDYRGPRYFVRISLPARVIRS